MTSRRNIVYFIIFTLLFWTIGPLMVYIVDPYHIFHETRWNKNLWFGSKTLINLGQIETYLKRSNDYDGILVGSSHTMNFKGSDLAKAVGAKGVLKLCGDGIRMDEIAWLSQAIIATYKVKNVFCTCEDFSMFPYTSYQSNKTYLSYPILSIVSFTSLENAFQVLWHKNLPSFSDLWAWDNLDNVHSWFGLWRGFNKKDHDFCLKGLRRLITEVNYHNCHVEYQPNAPIVAQFNLSLLALFRNNPSVNFYVISPPWAWSSFLHIMHHTRRTDLSYIYSCIFSLWRHLITACADLPNVKIYGWHDCAFVSNLANYCDESHYHPDINRYMAWCIEHDKHRLTKENYDAYEARCVENLRAFKILDSYPHRDTFDELVAVEMQDGN